MLARLLVYSQPQILVPHSYQYIFSAKLVSHIFRKQFVTQSSLRQTSLKMALELESTSHFRFHPVNNAGLRHAKNLTQESSRMLEQVLEENHNNNHIFTTTEDHRGVGHKDSLLFCEYQKGLMADHWRHRFTFTIILFIMILLSGPWAESQKQFDHSMIVIVSTSEKLSPSKTH